MHGPYVFELLARALARAARTCMHALWRPRLSFRMHMDSVPPECPGMFLFFCVLRLRLALPLSHASHSTARLPALAARTMP